MAETKLVPSQESSAPNGLTPDVLTKYKSAASIVASVLSSVIEKAIEGANILSLCKDGDRLIEEAVALVYNKDKKNPMPKGVAFPCTLSVNNVVCHFTPVHSDPSANQVLAQHDVVKILLGAHIDGYPAIAGETIIVGANSTSPITGVRADLIAAAYNATELALRCVKPGAVNWTVTDGVKKVLSEYKGTVRGLEGMISHQHQQNVLDGKKHITLFLGSEQHRDKDETFIFEEGEVYGLDVLLTTGEDPKPRSLGDRTTIFQKISSSYQLKMKTSRATYGEITKKAGSFPFTLRSLEDEQKARMGVKECVQHGLLKEFEITTTSDPKQVTAQFFVTFYVTANGAARITSAPTFYTGATSDKIKSEVKVQDEELSALLSRSLVVKKNKFNKKKGDAKE